jgi:hypothetical protein
LCECEPGSIVEHAACAKVVPPAEALQKAACERPRIAIVIEALPFGSIVSTRCANRTSSAGGLAASGIGFKVDVVVVAEGTLTHAFGALAPGTRSRWK